MSVSVIIPARNDAALLAQCLQALSEQTRAPDQVIVVNNGSTDDTPSVAQRWGARVIDEPVQGITRATAAGFDAATGDILGRLDADSVPPPQWVARIENELAPGSPFAAVTGSGTYYGGNALVRSLGKALYLGAYFRIVGWYLGQPPLYGSNFALRSDVWREVAPLIHRDVREIHDDLEITLHLKPGQAIKYLDDLDVPISARPFSSWSGLTRRVVWGFGTLALDVREGNHRGRRAGHCDWRVAQYEVAARTQQRTLDAYSDSRHAQLRARPANGDEDGPETASAY